MDSLLPALPIWVIVAVGLCLIVLVVSVGMSLFVLLFKVGVAIRESRRPPHLDAGDYRLDQGRDVRSEGVVRRETDGAEH